MLTNPTMSEAYPPHQATYFTVSHSMEVLKKLKRFKYFVPSVRIVGFFLFGLCVIGCLFFYLDYTAVVKVLTIPLQSERLLSIQIDGEDDGVPVLSRNIDFLSKLGDGVPDLKRKIDSLSELGDGVPDLRRKIDFFSELGDGCDVFDGDWVWDETYPLYESRSCNFLDEGFRCNENGRPDNLYSKWRWQPKNCNLPRFNATLVLEKLRNKRVVFAGDSIGRNQWESVLCMLASGVQDQNSIYEVNSSPITKHNGFLVFMIKDYNCTVEYYRTPFLVVQGRPPARSPRNVKTTLRLDVMDWSSSKWKNADILVLNTGHWWNYEKTIRSGAYFQEGGQLKMGMGVENAFRRSIVTVVDWINRELDTTKSHVFFRTYAPVHFRGGDWKKGGACHQETLPELTSSLSAYQFSPKFRTVIDVISMNSHLLRIKNVNLLNITYMSSRRKDAHASIYYSRSHPAPLHRQDCSHWCLPGVPDVWNELLFTVFMKH